ncbi:MAG: hypothetical protein Kow0069_36240 [Promethearchaeota archaeon]
MQLRVDYEEQIDADGRSCVDWVVEEFGIQFGAGCSPTKDSKALARQMLRVLEQLSEEGRLSNSCVEYLSLRLRELRDRYCAFLD